MNKVITAFLIAIALSIVFTPHAAEAFAWKEVGRMTQKLAKSPKQPESKWVITHLNWNQRLYVAKGSSLEYPESRYETMACVFHITDTQNLGVFMKKMFQVSAKVKGDTIDFQCPYDTVKGQLIPEIVGFLTNLRDQGPQIRLMRDNRYRRL